MDDFNYLKLILRDNQGRFYHVSVDKTAQYSFSHMGNLALNSQVVISPSPIVSQGYTIYYNSKTIPTDKDYGVWQFTNVGHLETARAAGTNIFVTSDPIYAVNILEAVRMKVNSLPQNEKVDVSMADWYNRP